MQRRDVHHNGGTVMVASPDPASFYHHNVMQLALWLGSCCESLQKRPSCGLDLANDFN